MKSKRPKIDWDAMAALFVPHHGTLRDFWTVAQAFFREESEGKEFTRRPTVSITLPAAGDPPARLVAVPEWNRRTHTLVLSRVCLEFLVDRFSITGEPQRSAEVKIHLDEGLPHIRRLSIRWGAEGIQRLVETVAQFLHDPAGVFSQSADHCCICRKALTDGASRARGVGPDCLRKANFLRELVERSLERKAESVAV